MFIADTSQSGQTASQKLTDLLQTLEPDAPWVQKHIDLIALMNWIRGDEKTPAACTTRVQVLLDVLQAHPLLAHNVQQWWRKILHTVDASSLLADFGFSSRNSFLSAFVQRLNHKLLPSSPETEDASELFSMVMSNAVDAQWLMALPESTLEPLAKLLGAPANRHHARTSPTLTYWQCSLMDAITFCTSQVRAAGFSPEIRVRMSASEQDESPFHTLASSLDAVRNAWFLDHELEEAAQQFKQQLESCRHFAATVYTHLDTHGISLDLVFRLRQLRERVLRIRTLLDCLLYDPEHKYSVRLLSQLVMVGQERASIRSLIKVSSSLLAAKISERSSATGEHYITRNGKEYQKMLQQAATGGAVTAVTTALKFAVMAVGLTNFWYGFSAGVVYAASFVMIQLLHGTLATKQTAMTAPAMAAKLKDLHEASAMEHFVDEVTCLIRSQTAAIIGNVVTVFPLVILLSIVLQITRGHSMIDAQQASYVLDSLALLGPSLFFAAFTGILLFSSSIVGGWFENWFVLHRLDSALRYNPRITCWLEPGRANRWAHFMRHNIAGFASNIWLGFMLGLIPVILAFLGLHLDVRHVTLSAGQLGAACAALGWEIVGLPAFWWALLCLPLIGVVNVGVSFYLAFRVALQAHSLRDLQRTEIRRSIGHRIRAQPSSFLWPQRDNS